MRVHPCRLLLRKRYQRNSITSSSTSSYTSTLKINKSTDVLKELNIEKQIDKNLNNDREFENTVIKTIE